MPQSLKLQLSTTAVIALLYASLLQIGVHAKEAAIIAFGATMCIFFWVSIIMMRRKTLGCTGLIALLLAPAVIMPCLRFSFASLHPLAGSVFVFGALFGLLAKKLEPEPRWVIFTSSLQIIAILAIFYSVPFYIHPSISAL